ncbi:type II toxin-antitoxin system RelE/ParE family toxin [Thiohalospira sp.]|uniref:type II toxin-antitoxin system RelE/ParE family toxin n=1 Tax=Thiohalospira sp. TaxID=3080549 RepID=UPI00398083B0
MSLPVRVRREAEVDLREAGAWYEAQRPSLGQAFLDEVQTAFEQIGEEPFRYPVLHRDTRRALIHRFPFGIFFRVTEEAIVIIAVLHASRDPRHWQARG